MRVQAILCTIGIGKKKSLGRRIIIVLKKILIEIMNCCRSRNMTVRRRGKRFGEAAAHLPRRQVHLINGDITTKKVFTSNPSSPTEVNQTSFYFPPPSKSFSALFSNLPPPLSSPPYPRSEVETKLHRHRQRKASSLFPISQVYPSSTRI